ncbi:HNH endonuclease signature motif containing protein [Spiroplasma mirum]|uniref:HNH endonuclease signature motif containing protein n=1 Tax=Spiroplasma mirum TaxID=2144 RepID=UPI0003E01311|nr:MULTISPECIES: HNH endonuclease signature motif containing protein [Spiroplasma]AHF60653.1 putative endonuclease [Spiroplasma mirum ATCC 29335]AKM52797.1 endonuclease [Spiroplasma atrichopogonis]
MSIEKNEIWKVHSDFPHLEFSNLGRIRNSQTKQIKELKKPKNTNYFLIRRRVDNKTKTKPLHRILVELFIGDVPHNMTVDHINGNPRDNRVENLEVVSRKENTVRQIKMWSHPHSFYDRQLIQAHNEKKWLYKDTLYNWIDLLKLLYRQNIIYYQVQWRSSKEGRIGYLPNGELIKRVKFKEMEKLLDD